MTDYIFEIQCYEKGNLLQEFAEYCGYKLGLYHFYNDHAVVDFIKPEELNLLIQQPIQFEIYAFTVKLSPVNKNLHSKAIRDNIRTKWREFASSKFPNYQEDFENVMKGKTQSL